MVVIWIKSRLAPWRHPQCYLGQFSTKFLNSDDVDQHRTSCD